MGDGGNICEGVSALLMQIARINRVEGERILSETGIRGGQEVVMGSLWEKDGQRTGDIAARIGVSAAGITKHVKNLTDAGFVRTQPDETDKRATQVFLTNKGQQSQMSVGARIRQLETELLAPLSPEQRTEFLGLLTVLVDGNRKRLQSDAKS